MFGFVSQISEETRIRFRAMIPTMQVSLSGLYGDTSGLAVLPQLLQIKVKRNDEH